MVKCTSCVKIIWINIYTKEHIAKPFLPMAIWGEFVKDINVARII